MSTTDCRLDDIITSGYGKTDDLWSRGQLVRLRCISDDTPMPARWLTLRTDGKNRLVLTSVMSTADCRLDDIITSGYGKTDDPWSSGQPYGFIPKLQRVPISINFAEAEASSYFDSDSATKSIG
ncbi:hypothetical protein TrispH2_008243 [Trichoplax sp. H2]|nr:hypothetical protein TrispH2_008243 [Trichoplax sp. H2]|eukprot:RDD39620.1 hypothetical protein TrispH2_008243 [Trichoplax sp. H2]